MKMPKSQISNQINVKWWNWKNNFNYKKKIQDKKNLKNENQNENKK
jgi:hypothetical protein